MSRAISSGLVAWGACVLGACASGGGQSDGAGGEIQLRVEAAATSDSVTLVLVNRSREEVGYNLCPSTLERQDGTIWQPVPSDRMCTMELRVLPAGRDVRYTTGVPAGLSPGSYRYRATVNRMGSGTPVALTSDVFRVSD